MTAADLVLVCREPCLSQIEEEQGAKNWMPLIENRALVSWLVRAPTEIEFQRSRAIKQQEIRRLEEAWRLRPLADLIDLEEAKQEPTEQEVLLHYRDPRQYREIFEPLIKLEAEYERRYDRSQTQWSVSIRWETFSSQSYVAHFMQPCKR